MRGAFGKPQGTVARVHIGQAIMFLSIRTKDGNRASAIEAFRRAKFKFPERQKIHVSKKWGFTRLNRDVYEKARAEDRLLADHLEKRHGPLSEWKNRQLSIHHSTFSLQIQ